MRLKKNFFTQTKGCRFDWFSDIGRDCLSVWTGQVAGQNESLMAAAAALRCWHVLVVRLKVLVRGWLRFGQQLCKQFLGRLHIRLHHDGEVSRYARQSC